MYEEVQKLIGLGKEYKIEEIKEEEKGNKKVKIISVSKTAKKERCPICNKFTKNIHDRLKPIELKHLDIWGYESRIKLIKRRFICHKCNKKFTEKTIFNEERESISNQLKQKILKDLLDYNLSIKNIAIRNNVSDNTVRKILETAMSKYPEYLRLLPKVISFDEFKADTKEGKYAFIVNDLIHKKVLDILPNRKKEYLIEYFSHCENRHSVEFVISDMYEPYLMVTKVMFPKAKYVVDRFHYTTYVMDALDNIRIKLQKRYGERSREYKLLKNKKNVSLLRKYSNEIDWWVYTKRYKNGHMVEMLKFDIREELLKIDNELKRGYQLKELFLDIIKHTNYEQAERELSAWIELCEESGIEEFIEASKTIKNWLPYIVSSFIDGRYSNGFTEGLNNKIKVIKRVGFGYKNFKFFRLRLLYILRGKISGKGKKDGFQKNKKR